MIIFNRQHLQFCIKRPLMMFRLTTACRFFSITIIITVFADKSLETCTSEKPYEAECADEEIIRGHPLQLSGSERKLTLITNSKEIPPGTFKLLPSLEVLEIDSILTLTTIEPGAFQNLQNLTRLTIYSYGLTHIRKNVFDDCPNLKYLDLDHNSIDLIDDEAFNKLTQLEELDLSHNQFEGIPKVLKGLTGLKRLNLNTNKFVKLIANKFNGLESLEILNLGGNKIQEIEKDAFKGLTKLKQLDLSGNKLKGLDVKNIANNLPKLNTVNLNDNVFDCTTLDRIVDDLRHNKVGVVQGPETSKHGPYGMRCSS